jgi:dienelactone hydrolase
VPRSPARADPARPATHRSSRLALVVLVAAALAAIGGYAASADGHRVDGSKHRSRRAYDVGEVECRFVDRSRTSVDYAQSAIGQVLPYRVLETEVRYPTYSQDGGAGAPASTKPFPLIVFAHGFSTVPDWYAPLLDEWVRAGFVVAAPVFPGTNAVAVSQSKNPDASEEDVVNQPGDIAFVVRSMLADSRARASACPRLHGLIDSSRIGIAGQSDGGDTVAMAAYDSRYDSHPGITYRAVAVLSGAEWYYPSTEPDPYSGHPKAPPLLVVQSATDACNPPQEAAQLYDDDANTSKWFLEIYDAEHLAPYDGRDGPAFAVVARTTTRFFEIQVAGDANGARLTNVGDSEPDVAHITTGSSAPAMTAVAQSSSACYEGLEGLKP